MFYMLKKVVERHAEGRRPPRNEERHASQISLEKSGAAEKGAEYLQLQMKKLCRFHLGHRWLRVYGSKKLSMNANRTNQQFR